MDNPEVIVARLALLTAQVEQRTARIELAGKALVFAAAVVGLWAVTLGGVLAVALALL